MSDKTKEDEETPALKEDKEAKPEKEKTDAVEENKENKEDGKEEKPKKSSKPIKKTIPAWATLSDEAKAKLAGQTKLKVASEARPNLEEVVVEAIKECADSKGVASAAAIRKYVKKNNPTWPKMLLKKGLNRALDKKRIKRVKGLGLAGSFKVDTTYKPTKAAAKKPAAGKKGDKKAAAEKPKVPLADIFPMVFTWACNPKEASVGLIRKYINKHHSDLATDGAAFKKAIENGVAKGQLNQLTGKGLSGTFQLVDGANKTGAKYEDAIEDAIIAMNEPKDISVTSLRNYLGEYHKEYNTDQRPRGLKNALDQSEARGHLQHISGKGFTGTYRLSYPFYPSPYELWGEEAKPEKKAKREVKKRASKKDDSSDEEEESSSEEESSDEESDEEVMPAAKKRGAPKPRKEAVAVKKPKKSAPEKKAKRAAPVKKPVAKKAPAKNKRKGRK